MGDLLHRSSHPGGNEVAEDRSKGDAEETQTDATPSDPVHQRREVAARAADEQYAKNSAAGTRQRNGMHRLWTIGPLDCLGVLPPGLFHTRDQGLELRRLGPLAGCVDQRLAQAVSLDIPVQ